jgi:hypothetical protein
MIGSMPCSHLRCFSMLAKKNSRNGLPRGLREGFTVQEMYDSCQGGPIVATAPGLVK